MTRILLYMVAKSLSITRKEEKLKENESSRSTSLKGEIWNDLCDVSLEIRIEKLVLEDDYP